MSRIKLPRTFEEQYVVFLNILKKHNEDGASSPLNDNFDMNMLETKATNANMSNTKKDEYERLAEIETEARKNEWSLVKKRMRNIGQFLKAKFSDNPHMLGLWGFTVDDYTAGGGQTTPVLNKIKGTIVYVLGTPFTIGLGGENGEQVVIKPGDSRSIPKTFHGMAVDFENIDYAAAGTYNFTVEGKTVAVREIHINDAQMSSFSLPDDMPILTEVVLQGNNLDQTSVNNLPIVLAKNEVINGVVSIVGGGNAVPDMSNPEVAAAISQLQARGWTILTN